MTARAPESSLSRLDQLAAELDRESVALMVEDYIKDLPVRLAELDQFLKDGRHEELERTAHSLTGVSASFGLDQLSTEFRAIEEATSRRDFTQVQRFLPTLRTAAVAAEISLRNWLKQKSAEGTATGNAGSAGH